jgi:3-deoxy-D-manno-octulosonate 8-phosphate phosphatase (KDO 8-P phosphatase)
VLDVDGVLTDGKLYYSGDGPPARAFHAHDGVGIELFQAAGGEVVLLTAKSSAAIAARAEELGVRHVIQGSRDKLGDLTRLLTELEIPLAQVAAMGDDLPDLPVLRACGYPLAPAGAAAEVREVARYVTSRPGGDGAVREAVEHLLRVMGRREAALSRYGAQETAGTYPRTRNAPAGSRYHTGFGAGSRPQDEKQAAARPRRTDRES